ncbi:Type II secretion system protein F [subsurface metagenome]
MPVYEYKALDEEGKKVSGIVEADSPREARTRLRAENLRPTNVEASKEKISLTDEVKVERLLRRVRNRDITAMTRQLATLLRSGMPLVQSLNAIIEQLEKHPLQRIVYIIREKVDSGSSLTEALESLPKYFTPLYVSMVRAGEASGALEEILKRLADHMEKTQRQRNRVRSILVYPVFMTFVGGAVLIFLMTYIVPILAKLFGEMNQKLPLPTEILIATSKFMKSYFLFSLPVLAVACVLLYKYTRRGRGQAILHRFKLRMPLFGSLHRKLMIARFSRTLGTLIAGGTPLLQAMDIVKNVVGNVIIGGVISRAKESIARGETIVSELKKSKEFPPIVTHMISIGETSGNLEEMLFNVADAYDDEVETTIDGLTSILEPLIIIIMGIVVGFIVLSILMPIFQINRFAG